MSFFFFFFSCFYFLFLSGCIFDVAECFRALDFGNSSCCEVRCVCAMSWHYNVYRWFRGACQESLAFVQVFDANSRLPCQELMKVQRQYQLEHNRKAIDRMKKDLPVPLERVVPSSEMGKAQRGQVHWRITRQMSAPEWRTRILQVQFFFAAAAIFKYRAEQLDVW